jgi:hypothetical protein
LHSISERVAANLKIHRTQKSGPVIKPLGWYTFIICKE